MKKEVNLKLNGKEIKTTASFFIASILLELITIAIINYYAALAFIALFNINATNNLDFWGIYAALFFVVSWAFNGVIKEISDWFIIIAVFFEKD